ERDHQAEIGDVPARGMLVARDREAADDPALVLRDEDGGVRIPANGPQVAPLIGHLAPAVRRDEPPFGLRANCLTQAREALRIGWLGAADDHSTTTPAPPRLGSPAAASSPSTNVTAEAPP